jgi:hypothetical protein
LRIVFSGKDIRAIGDVVNRAGLVLANVALAIVEGQNPIADCLPEIAVQIGLVRLKPEGFEGFLPDCVSRCHLGAKGCAVGDLVNVRSERPAQPRDLAFNHCDPFTALILSAGWNASSGGFVLKPVNDFGQ